MPCQMYDLNLLSLAKLPIDSLVKPITMRSRSENRMWKGLNDVTPEIVDGYARDAKRYVRQIKASPSVYGYLYFVAENSGQWHTAPHFDYMHFPLMKHQQCVLSRIKKLALETGSKPNTNEMDATCLYLLYFYALLINPSLNWITVDYLSNGNRYHQFGTRLQGKMKVIHKKVWT